MLLHTVSQQENAMSDVGNGRSYYYEGLFGAEEPHDGEQRRAFARERDAQAERVRVLRDLLTECEKTLLMWSDVAPAVSLLYDIRAALESTQ